MHGPGGGGGDKAFTKNVTGTCLQDGKCGERSLRQQKQNMQRQDTASLFGGTPSNLLELNHEGQREEDGHSWEFPARQARISSSGLEGAEHSEQRAYIPIGN